jgi:release factor glutamine methyltransferase
VKLFGFVLSIPPSVYEPAEDSFLLADAAKGITGEVLEIGCGSGVVSLVCSNSAKSVLGVDINPDAVLCATENANKNQVKNIKFLESDLFSKIPKKKFDYILFNPPYLPTSKKEKVKTDLNHAFDGGISGRKVLDSFLDRFDSFLKPGGSVFLVQSSLNNERKTVSQLIKLGYMVDVVKTESFFFEKLSVIKATKP